MEYLTNILGVDIVRLQWTESKKLPYIFSELYEFQLVDIDDLRCLFVKPKEALPIISTLKKQLDIIKKTCRYPIVIELNKITRQKRKSLIESRIPFVVKDNQIYMPFLGIALKEQYSAETNDITLKKMMPVTQFVLFWFIYSGCKPVYLTEIQKQLNLSAMSASRAAKQLIELNLIHVKNEGRSVIVETEYPPKELFNKAKEYLINPVRRAVYINKSDLSTEMFISGLTAIAELSMLNEPSLITYGIVKPIKEVDFTDNLVDADKQYKLEFWKYDTRILSGADNADILSLAVCFENAFDERTKIQIDKLMEKVWK